MRLLITVLKAGEGQDILVVEIGGAVVILRGAVFGGYSRDEKLSLENMAMSVHLTLVPYIKVAGELKTNPALSRRIAPYRY